MDIIVHLHNAIRIIVILILRTALIILIQKIQIRIILEEYIISHSFQIMQILE